jgi:membrane fusion protein
LNPKAGLFRTEAVKEYNALEVGEILIVRPITFKYVVTFSMLVVAALIVLFGLGTFNKRTLVVGEILPEKGLIRITPARAGLVVARHVEVGSVVKKGDVLFVVSSERYDLDKKPLIKAEVDGLAKSIELLQAEINQLEIQSAHEASALPQSLSRLKEKAARIESQINSQNQLLAVSLNAVSRYSELLQKGYVSVEQVQIKKTEYNIQFQRRERLLSETTAVDIEADELREKSRRAVVNLGTQISTLRRQLGVISNSARQKDHERDFPVTATVAGVVSSISVGVGQSVLVGGELLTLVPEHSTMEAVLYASSSAVGFVTAGDEVELRFDAYPYQHYGFGRGRVISVTGSTANPYNSAGRHYVDGASAKSDFFLIRVALQDQSITINDVRYQLKAGLTVQANLMRPKQRLYELFLEPFYRKRDLDIR